MCGLAVGIAMHASSRKRNHMINVEGVPAYELLTDSAAAAMHLVDDLGVYDLNELI